MIEVTDETFEEEVINADLPTLVDFWAAWCGPCRRIAPIVEEIAHEYDGRLRVVKFDVDQNPLVPSHLGVMSIPTLILFVDGAEAGRWIGYRPKANLVEAIEAHLS